MTICHSYPSCKRKDGGCQCLDFQQRCERERKVKEFAAKHGYSYSWPYFPKSLKMHLKKVAQ